MRSPRFVQSAVLLVALVAASGVAHARNVYLNGVKLESTVAIQPQTFLNCDVRFDERGDIYINAKGYKVVVNGPGGPDAETRPPPAPSAQRSFWLISKQSVRGAVQYDVNVFVNDVLVKKVKSIDEPTVLDISKHVTSGRNTVRMIAIKNIGERRASMSPTDTMEIMVGEGIMSGGTVTVDKVHLTFRRTAAETQNLREDFDLKAP